MTIPENHTLACRFIVTADGDLHADDTPENRDLARRVLACVNACEGISTQELEQGIVADMRRVIAGVAPLLREKRDDLERQMARHEEGRDAVA
ncbi:MAG: hypothetical protein WD069_20555 [Planctomycetales bacterium]